MTEKVQKEVEIAEEMDKNILKSLEADSKGLSFIDELMKISPSISKDLKQILFKTLQEGPEVSLQNWVKNSFSLVQTYIIKILQKLTVDEKSTLIESCDLREQIRDEVKQFEGIQAQLLARLEMEQRSKKELINDSSKKQTELNRLEMVLSYYDERISFLV